MTLSANSNPLLLDFIARLFSCSGLGKGTASLISGMGKSIGGLTALIGQATEGLDVFVAALSPGTMIQFNQAIRDLNATVATAFLPIFQTFTDVLKDIAGELAPVMRQLAPIMKSLAESIANIVLPVVKIFAAALQALMPFFQMVADLIAMVVDALQPIFALIQAWASLGNIMATVLLELAPVFKYLAEMLKTASERLLLFAVSVAKALGAMNFVEQVKAALRHDKKVGEHAAGTVSMKGVQALNNDIQKLAFLATGGSGGERQKSDTERLIEEIEKVNPNETIKSIIDVLREIKELVMKLIPNWEQLPGGNGKEGNPVLGNNLIGRNVQGAGEAIGDAAVDLGNWFDRNF